MRRIARILPFAMVGKVGAAMGAAVFLLTPIRKRITLDNLRHAFPEKTEQQHRTIALGAFRNYGRAILDMFWAGGAKREEILRVVRVVNPEIAQSALNRGKGLIFLSAHFGSWEFLLSAVPLSIGLPLLAIVQQQRNKRIDRVIDEQRRRFDVTTVVMSRSVREAIKVLRQGKVLLLLGDQSGSKEAIYVPFFGRSAATHRGPAVFALKTGAALVMILLVRREDGHYDLRLEEVVYNDIAEPTEEHIVELTRRHTAMLEQRIRELPDHWLWMHKRWKHTQHCEAAVAGRNGDSVPTES